jgi:aspartate carbamoyltransferase catalytic subunit
VNRGVEMSGGLLDDRSICLVEDQVRNGIPIRMALLYLMAASDPVAESSRASGPS